MLLKIDTSDVKFRVAGTARAKKDPKNREAQASTLDGRPVWIVRLTAIETARESSETIWVEVAGDEPKLTVDDLVQVHGLVYSPWVNRDHKIVRNFRAEQVMSLDSVRKAA